MLSCLVKTERFRNHREADVSITIDSQSVKKVIFIVKAAFNAHFFKYIGNTFCVNENFMSITGAFSGISVNKIKLKHYFCRSAEEFNSKIKRGRGDTGTVRTMEDFYIHDIIADKIEDTTILEIFK